MALDQYKTIISKELNKKKEQLHDLEMDSFDLDRRAIYIKKIKGNNYIYVNDGRKGEFHYKLLGNENSFSKSELKKLISNSEKFKQDAAVMNELKSDIDKLERILKILG